jgi:hypothetical protein
MYIAVNAAAAQPIGYAANLILGNLLRTNVAANALLRRSTTGSAIPPWLSWPGAPARFAPAAGFVSEDRSGNNALLGQ